MDIDRLEAEGLAIANAIAARKQRAMIYQVDAKELAAQAVGLPRDAYHDLPYHEWMDIRRVLLNSDGTLKKDEEWHTARGHGGKTASNTERN